MLFLHLGHKRMFIFTFLPLPLFLMTFLLLLSLSAIAFDIDLPHDFISCLLIRCLHLAFSLLVLTCILLQETCLCCIVYFHLIRFIFVGHIRN